MTTDKTIAFIRNSYDLLHKAYDVYAAHAHANFIRGLITMAAAHFIIDFPTEEILMTEVNKMYNDYVDNSQAHK